MRRRAIIALVGAALLVPACAVAAGGFTPPCDNTSNRCLDRRVDALEKWVQEHDQPAPTVTVTATPTSTATPTGTPTTEPTGTDPLAGLPRVPWEGGPAYYKKFPNADAGQWDNPSFFPIAVWYNGISSDEEVQWDKAHGINTYMGMWPGTDFGLFERNDVYWIGGPLQNAEPTSPNWVGNLLDDEVDGRFTPAEGRAHLQSLVDQYAGNGKFNYANYTSMVVQNDLPAADAQAYVNQFTDTVSLDMYWYTVPFCDWDTYRGDSYVIPVEEANCRTASSYGKTTAMLRQQDAADGHLQPIWQFVENLNGGPGEQFTRHIDPAELKGAAMSSLINEARGIVWFNSSLSGPCQGNPVIRLAQVQGDGYCGKDQVAAMGEVNNLIHSLAPILNTQSYAWDFGPGVETMLKAKDGSAYVFAMIDGETQPGQRTLTLPDGLTAKSVAVVGEDRNLPVTDGRFTDTFTSENTYHIYRVNL